jgi:class 3 adenylate cyclase
MKFYPEDRMTNRVLTIAFTDIKGFTDRTAHADRDFVVRLLKSQDDLLRPIIRQYAGTIIKTIGDAFLLTFESPTNAVLCALMMQNVLREHNQKVPEGERIEIRVAINTGEVSIKDGDVFGEPVNLASRIEGITDANEIWFSESTYLAMNKQEVPTSLVGEFRLKGVPEAIKVFRVVQDLASDQFQAVLRTQQDRLVAGGFAEPDIGPRSFLLKTAIVFLLAIGVATGGWHGYQQHRRHHTSTRARQHMDSAEFTQALALTESLLSEDPADTEARKLCSDVFAAAIKYYADRKEIKEARSFYDTAVKRFPALEGQADLETALVLEEVKELQRTSNRKEVTPLLRQLADRYPAHFPTVFAVAKAFDASGHDYTQTIEFFERAAKLDLKKVTQDPVFHEHARWFLRTIAPEDGYDTTRNLIASHCFSVIEPLLQEGLAGNRSEDRTLRWNALYLLEQAGKPVDRSAVCLLELLQASSGDQSVHLAEAITCFLPPASPATAIPGIPATLDEFKLFDRGILEPTSPYFRLAVGPFRQALDDWLKRTVVDPDNYVYRRINAFNALTIEGIDEVTTAAFHLVNFWDWKGMIGKTADIRQLFLDALATLAKSPPDEAVFARTGLSVDDARSRTQQTLDALSFEIPRIREHLGKTGDFRENQFWQTIASDVARLQTAFRK